MPVKSLTRLDLPDRRLPPRFYALKRPCTNVVLLLFSPCVEILFYFLAASQILLGLYLIGQGWQWLGYVRRRVMTDPGFYAPRTAVLCPCRGLEPGLERNLVSLCEFDHRNYEVFFILASASDPAHSIVKRVASQSRAKAHVVVTGRPDGCSEKVNNLRLAIEQLPPEFEVLVFADSDGRPGKTWLHHLVAPHNDSRIGATTTMRWLIPNRTNLPAALLAAWNAPVVTMLSDKGKNFCWGGGTTIRRSLFDQIGVADEWLHSFSDDYSMTRALERAGRSILFVPECLTLSYIETDFPGLIEFTNRQILITRVYAEKIWNAAAATHLLFCVTLVLGGVLTFGNMLASLPALQLGTLTFLPLLLAAIRGALRLVAVAEALPAARSQIMGQAWIYIVLGVFISFLYLVNFAMSLVTRKTRWRGVLYEVISPNQTRVLSY
ncbi:MAG TPA: glycosyltransferase family 2 protein [Candidatus Acidoferrum sp.]|nr:glycosyltransferase family 2 protein [Candidatus Acidoferrum sp.]